MNNVLRRNIIRGIFIILIQIILLKRIDISFGSFNYIHFTIYPIIIALLPYKMNKTVLVFIGFSLGLFIDLFYDSVGIHAFAATFTAYFRHYLLNLISPPEGYGKDGLTSYGYGIGWFLTYAGIMFFLHLLILYSLEAFSPVYTKEILLQTIFSFIASLFLVTVGQLIFNPKY